MRKNYHMKTSREIELEQVKLAITRTDAELSRVEGVITQMRGKQISRHRELMRQETIASRKTTGPANPKRLAELAEALRDLREWARIEGCVCDDSDVAKKVWREIFDWADGRALRHRLNLDPQSAAPCSENREPLTDRKKSVE